MRKNKKFALGFKIATLLTCITLVSVGFASWLIVKQPAEQKGEGTVQAFTVDDAGLDLEIKPKNDDEDTKLVFGQQAFLEGTGESFDGTNHHWLMAEGVEDEALTAYFTLTIKDTTEEAATFELIFMLDSVLDEKIADLVNANVITVALNVNGSKSLDGTSITPINESASWPENGVPTIKVSKDQWVAAGRPETLDVQIKIDWGTVLNSKNPYRFYNNFPYGTDFNVGDANKGYIYGVEETEGKILVQDVAKAVLTAINELNEATYTLTVTGRVKPVPSAAPQA